ncbi:MAG TPA: histidine phosphatase family protein [Vicinamibacterales bacterium]|nr:histidine phosphatase family protein [Vicinamibacterales bacterium]
MTRLYLVRHGATTTSGEDRFAGAIDVELSEEGRAQAAALARRLSHTRLAAAYCSPMKRTRETAAILAAPHGLIATETDGLREVDHGHWEGLTRAEVETRFAAEYASWEEDPFTFAPDGGESGVHLIARALPVIRRIVVEHQDHAVLVVSHKATLRLLISSLLGFDPRGYRDRLDQSPTGLSIVDFKDPVRARLMLFNDTSHYEPCPLPAGPRLSKWWGGGPSSTTTT